MDRVLLVVGPLACWAAFSLRPEYLSPPKLIRRNRNLFAPFLENQGRMSKSCKGLAMELVKCLSETDCVKAQNRPYRECAGEKEPSISSECIGLRETYFNCKRGQVDMRARIRGNKGY